MLDETFNLTAKEKKEIILPQLNALTRRHLEECVPYKNIINAFFNSTWANDIAEVPYLAVGLFKQLQLSSTREIYKTIYSSGTGGTPSQIHLDKHTAQQLSRVLAQIIQSFIGKKRMPMIIIDAPNVLKERNTFSARAAGIQGMSLLGHHHCYALNEDMSLNLECVEAFKKRHGDQPVLMFGFTFMVWLYFIQALASRGIDNLFSEGYLIHSGGWKKLEQEKVSATTFNTNAKKVLGVSNVHNFYGMAEQVGSVFVSCEYEHFHCSNFSDVLVRNPASHHCLKKNEPGLLQVFSTIPNSYPGHSLLTEDIGMIVGEDDCPCGRKGKVFQVHGRLPKTEARGCSDTFSGAN